MTLAEIIYKTNEITKRIDNEISFYKSLLDNKLKSITDWAIKKKSEYNKKYIDDPDILATKLRNLESEVKEKEDKVKKDIQDKVDSTKSSLMDSLSKKKSQMTQSNKDKEEEDTKIESDNNTAKANINNYLI